MFLSFLLLGFVSLAQASPGEIFADLFSRPEKKPWKLSYEVKEYEEKSTKSSPGSSFDQRKHKTEASIPLYTGDPSSLRLKLDAGLQEIATQARFTADNRVMPNQLWNLNSTLIYQRALPEDQRLSATLSVGSASNIPFASTRESVVGANLVWRIPDAGKNFWLFFVNYSNARNFANNVPLPGAAYFFGNNEKLKALVGIPFFTLFYTPFDKMLVSLIYFPVTNINLRASYFLFGPAQIYAQFRWDTETYFLANRVNRKDKLFEEEKSAFAGFSMPLERFAILDLQGGYSFGHFFYQGEDRKSRRLSRKLSLENAKFLNAKVTFAF